MLISREMLDLEEHDQFDVNGNCLVGLRLSPIFSFSFDAPISELKLAPKLHQDENGNNSTWRIVWELKFSPPPKMGKVKGGETISVWPGCQGSNQRNYARASHSWRRRNGSQSSFIPFSHESEQ